MYKNRLISILFFFGLLFSPFYSLAMIIRAWLYARRIIPSTKLPIPVLSVGNLTMGGTGKTPMVMYLVRLLAQKMRPAIISRGYGGKSKRPVNIVSDGTSILLGPDEAGDEPVLLARTLGVPVLTGPRRVQTGRHIIRHNMADVLVMDDGYQHLALDRDLDLALFSGQCLLDNERVFPSGLLREPRRALKRADCFVITGVSPDNKTKVEAFSLDLRRQFPDTPVFQGYYKTTSLLGPQGTTRPLNTLRDMPLFAFCGIANPDSFFNILADNDLFLIRGRRSFADHHPFAAQDIASLSEQATALGCKALITTEKDAVKLTEFSSPLPIWTLRVELMMDEGFDQFIWTKIGAAGYR